MELQKIIDWYKANPQTVAITAGAYLAVGILVLWSICRSGNRGLPNFTGVARALLTAVFALPIWPVVWLVWILHFRKYAPDAIDLTAYHLPIIDLAEHRSDDLRFAPRKLVLDAEIVESPEVGDPTDRKRFTEPVPPKKPRVKTQPVSAVVAEKGRAEEAKISDGPGQKEAPGTSHPKPPATTDAAADAAKAPKVETVDEPKSEASSGSDSKPSVVPKSRTPDSNFEPLKASEPNFGTAPPPPVIRPKDNPGPVDSPKPAAAMAPRWRESSITPRTPEPPSAPPFVKKLERLAQDEADGSPAPFPSPSQPPSTPAGENSTENAPADREVAKNPDVPEIPIH